MPLTLALGRQRQISKCETSLVYRACQASQGYTEKTCLKKPRKGTGGRRGGREGQGRGGGGKEQEEGEAEAAELHRVFQPNWASKTDSKAKAKLTKLRQASKGSSI